MSTLEAVISETKRRQLPKNWRWVKIKEICTLNPRRLTISRDDDEPTSFVPMESIDAVEGIISDLQVRKYGEIKSGYTYFEENDVLFAKITPCMQNGKHAIAKGLIDGFGFGTTEFHVIRANDETIPEWIHAFLRQPHFLQKAMGAFHRSSWPTKTA